MESERPLKPPNKWHLLFPLEVPESQELELGFPLCADCSSLILHLLVQSALLCTLTEDNHSMNDIKKVLQRSFIFDIPNNVF